MFPQQSGGLWPPQRHISGPKARHLRKSFWKADRIKCVREIYTKRQVEVAILATLLANYNSFN